MSKHENDRAFTIGLSVFAITFVGLTVFGVITDNNKKQGGQPESGVVHVIPQTTTSPCPEPVETDTIAQLKDKLLVCRVALEDLTAQVHDEFDLD